MTDDTTNERRMWSLEHLEIMGYDGSFHSRRLSIRLLLLLSLLVLPVRATETEALVRGTLIDGFGGTPGIPMKFHSQSTWNELDVWVNHMDLPAMDTVRGATYWPAVVMGVEKDYGTVREGKYADIVAVKGDVLRYMSLLQKIDLVVKWRSRIK